MNHERKAYDLASAAWLTPVREAFHDFLQAQGYTMARLQTPPPGGTYPGSHAQAYWECWLAATLAAQPKWISADALPTPDGSREYLVWNNSRCEVATFERTYGRSRPEWWSTGIDAEVLADVTHWQPLPPPPSANPTTGAKK